MTLFLKVILIALIELRQWVFQKLSGRFEGKAVLCKLYLIINSLSIFVYLMHISSSLGWSQFTPVPFTPLEVIFGLTLTIYRRQLRGHGFLGVILMLFYIFLRKNVALLVHIEFVATSKIGSIGSNFVISISMVLNLLEVGVIYMKGWIE